MSLRTNDETHNFRAGKRGDDVIIVSAVSDEEAKKKYPDGWKAPKPYLRIVPQPQ